MNEELQSANEELQSTNEELETSKEELQSVNEELLTVNSELQSSMTELARVNSDMNNLLASTGIATIFLDEDLRIKRYTPATRDIIKLIDADVGRPLTDIATNLRFDDMASEMEQVLGSLSTRERVVPHGNGKWYLVRILPYRSVGNVIEGLVVTFIDVTEEKQAREDSEDALAYAQGIVDTVREPLVVLNGDLNVVSANGSFYSLFKVTPEETVGRHIFELGDRQWDIPELKDQLGRVLPESLEFKDFAVNHDFPRIGRGRMMLNARRIVQHGRKTEYILLAIEDVTDLRRTR